MDKSYEYMLELAYERDKRFEEAEAIYRKRGGECWQLNAVKRACEACAYMDAIADMFGKGYDEVYEAVHELHK